MNEADWLGLCLVTESEQAHEWGPICWVVRNRTGDRRFADTIRGVVLQRKQFSHFNAFEEQIAQMRNGTMPEAMLFDHVIDGIADGSRRVRKIDMEFVRLASKAAQDFLVESVWRRPFGPRVCHYYSPVSMKPKGSAPAWAKQAKRLFTPSGVDPERFIFCEGVP